MFSNDTELRFGQFSLKSMLVFTALVAIYFSLARCCGHLSAAIATFSLALLIGSRAGKWFKRHAWARIAARLLVGCALWFALCDRIEKEYYCPRCEHGVSTDVYRVVGITLAVRECVARTIDGKLVVDGSCAHAERQPDYEVRWWGLAIPEWHAHRQPGTWHLLPFWDGCCGAFNESCSLQRVREMGRAMARYRAVHRCYPPEYVADKEGRPMHSWRVLLLPYFESDETSELFKQYDMTQPWNSPKNRALAKQIPGVYTSPYDSTHHCPITPYVAVSGEETLWPGARAVKLSEIKDDPSKRIAIIEAANSDINWMEPRDIPFSQASLGIRADDGPGIRSYRASKIPVLLASGDRAWLPVGGIHRPPKGSLDDHWKPTN